MRRLLLILLERLCNRLQSQPKTTNVTNIYVGGDMVVNQQKKVIVIRENGNNNKS